MMSKLLLVEDDQSIVSSLSDYLGNEGFKIESASGQKEAIEKLDNDQYDIALVDIQLSNGNGFSVCSAIIVLWQDWTWELTIISVNHLDQGSFFQGSTAY